MVDEPDDHEDPDNPDDSDDSDDPGMIILMIEENTQSENTLQK